MAKNSACVNISVSIEKAIINKLDEERGMVTRSRYINYLLKKAINEGGKK